MHQDKDMYWFIVPVAILLIGILLLLLAHFNVITGNGQGAAGIIGILLIVIGVVGGSMLGIMGSP